MSHLQVMALVNQIVPSFYRAKVPKSENRQLRTHLIHLEEACTSTWRRCEKVLQCHSWAAEDVLLASTPTKPPIYM